MNTTKMIATIALAVILSLLASFAVYTGIAAICLSIASVVFEFKYTIWHVLLTAATFEVSSLTFGRAGSGMAETIKEYIEGQKREAVIRKVCNVCDAFSSIKSENKDEKVKTRPSNIGSSCIIDVDVTSDAEPTEHSKYLKLLSDYSGTELENDTTKPQEVSISLDKLHYAIPSYPMMDEYEEDTMPPRFYGKE